MENNITYPSEYKSEGEWSLECSKCEQRIRVDYNFCPKCGRKIDWSRRG